MNRNQLRTEIAELVRTETEGTITTHYKDHDIAIKVNPEDREIEFEYTSEKLYWVRDLRNNTYKQEPIHLVADAVAEIFNNRAIINIDSYIASIDYWDAKLV